MFSADRLRKLLQAVQAFCFGKPDCVPPDPPAVAPLVDPLPGPEEGLEPVFKPEPVAERPKMKLEIYEDDQGYWRWRFRAKNSRIVAESGEGFAKKFNAERAVKAFMARLLEDEFAV